MFELDRDVPFIVVGTKTYETNTGSNTTDYLRAIDVARWKAEIEAEAARRVAEHITKNPAK